MTSEEDSKINIKGYSEEENIAINKAHDKRMDQIIEHQNSQLAKIREEKRKETLQWIEYQIDQLKNEIIKYEQLKERVLNE